MTSAAAARSCSGSAAGYTLSFAALLVTGGRLGDVFGRRRMFLIGVAGVHPDVAGVRPGVVPGQLIVLRVLQGMTAAVLIPQGFGVIKQVFPPDKIGQAFAAFGPVLGLSAVVAPIIGGLLVSADLFGWGWRAIFLVNVPVGPARLDRWRRLPAQGRHPRRCAARLRRHAAQRRSRDRRWCSRWWRATSTAGRRGAG